MRSRSVCLLALFLFLASAASAGPISYWFTVDTSSLPTSGYNSIGFIDFQFNPGSGSQLAYAKVRGFATDGTLAACGAGCITGDVTPPGVTLPNDLTFTNTTVWNDYYQGITFGNFISFMLDLYGPALSAPNGSAGTTFAFSILDQSTPSNGLLTNDQVYGYAFTVDVDSSGNTTVTNNSDETSINPEPASLLLVGAPLLVFAARRLRRRPANRG